MKEVIKNKWIIVFVIMVLTVFYIGADTPKTFDEDEKIVTSAQNL